MGVVYVGDRATGKTALAMELANPQFDYVRVSNQNYEDLKKKLTRDGEMLATQVDSTNAYHNRPLNVEVKLPAGARTISVDWIDTPGEIWHKSFPSTNPDQWRKVLATVQQSEGIMLILPPYREMYGLKPEIDQEEFPTETQWCNRFRRWVDFFCQDCRKARHIVLCLNKADLFCDLSREAFEIGYQPSGSRRNWYQRNNYVYQQYFRPVQSQIATINQQNQNVKVRCFITSIYNRSLLELPWIYLASHLAS